MIDPEIERIAGEQWAEYKAALEADCRLDAAANIIAIAQRNPWARQVASLLVTLVRREIRHIEAQMKTQDRAEERAFAKKAKQS